jgi:hypothetical protein
MESRRHIPAERLAKSGPVTPARGEAGAGVAARVVQPRENAVLHGTSLGRRTNGVTTAARSQAGSQTPRGADCPTWPSLGDAVSGCTTGKIKRILRRASTTKSVGAVTLIETEGGRHQAPEQRVSPARGSAESPPALGCPRTARSIQQRSSSDARSNARMITAAQSLDPERSRTSREC